MTFQVHTAERGLTVETANMAAMLAAVPTAFQLTPTIVGMPHGVDETIRLNSMGIGVTSPILSYYDWPRDRTLVPEPFYHQPITAAFLIANPHAYCLNGIGTGKTLTAAWAADFLMREGYVHRCGVVAPLSALERAWGDTFFFHFPHRKYTVLHGDAKRRRKRLALAADFYIVNPDGVKVLERELIERDDIDLWIIDEIALYRNKQTAQWESLNNILYPLNHKPKPYAWGLTGAPIPQYPTDAYGQCKLITPITVPKYFTSFRNMTMEKQNEYVWTARPEAIQIVHKAMQPAIRFKRDDCLDLPGEIFTTRDVALSPEQTKHYKEVAKELYTEVQGGKITAVNEAVKRIKLLQIVCGVVFDTNKVPREIPAGNRIEELLQTIEQCNEKVIVFVPFTEVTNMLHREVSKHWSTAVVYGGVPKGQRDKIFSDFQQKPDPSVLIAHPECMAHALTLTEASTIVWYAPTDSNEDYEQANGRITRAGQKYVANIINLAGSPLERKMYKRLEERQATQGILLEMVEKNEL